MSWRSCKHFCISVFVFCPQTDRFEICGFDRHSATKDSSSQPAPLVERVCKPGDREGSEPVVPSQPVKQTAGASLAICLEE